MIGSLSRVNPDLTYVDLSALTFVSGYFSLFSNFALRSAQLSALTFVGSNFVAWNDYELRGITADVLARVGGDLSIRSNDELTSLNFPALTYVGINFYVQYNGRLSNIRFSALRTIVSNFDLRYNFVLTLASVPNLSAVGSYILICSNSNSFIIPNPAVGTSASPGITSMTLKGQVVCYNRNGSNGCFYDPCP
jgi:hypothetical protein